MINKFLITIHNFIAKPVLAQITNPVIGDFGNNADEARTGVTFTAYFILIWRAIITVGALMVIIYFLWGAISWISAGGDSSNVEKARNRMTQAVIGMIILVSSFTLIGFISVLFFGEEFNILSLTFGTGS